MQRIFDPCNPSLKAAQIAADPSFHIDYVGSDEAADEGDIQPVGPHSISLRIERSGTSLAGHTYHVGSSYTNEVGAKTSFDCRFGVPHDMGEHAVAQDRWTAPAGSPDNPGSVTFYP